MVLSLSYDTDWLIAQAKRFESLAVSSQTFNDEDLIEFFNSELQINLTPIVQSVNEEFGVMTVELPMTSLPARIRIPSQATGARLRNVQFVTNQGFVTKFPRLNPDKLGDLALAWNIGFYIQNNELIFYPTPPLVSSGVLRVSYFRRPNTLCSTLSSGRIINIDLLGNTISLDNAPNGLDWVPGNRIDVIIGESPFDFRVQSATIVAITGAVIELDPSVMTEVELGDYVALQGQSPVAQFVPLEAMQLLAQMGATRCLQSLGDTEGFKISMAKVTEMKQHLLNLISDRVEGQPKRISAVGLARRNRNTSSRFGA